MAVLAGCTSGEDGSTGPTGDGATTLVPTPAETLTGAPGTAVYTYVNGALVVTVELDGNAGTMTVDNGTESEVGAPDVYVLDAVDGHEIEGEVSSAVPVVAGERATFGLTIGEITDAGNIGLLVLLLGADNYGAFVRTG
jgi:hypothetical protein